MQFFWRRAVMVLGALAVTVISGLCGMGILGVMAVIKFVCSFLVPLAFGTWIGLRAGNRFFQEG